MTNKFDKLNKEFSINFRWNIFGSIFYECLKVGHQILLLHVMESYAYGLFGSIFSLIYLSIYLSELGLGNTLTPFLNIFIKSKKNFKTVFFKYYFSPQILISVFVGILVTIFYYFSFFYNQNSPYLLTIPLIIFFESIRIFLRRFLHTVSKSKVTVISEMILMPFYLTQVWSLYFIFNYKMTLNFIFIPYLIDSILGAIVFCFFTKNFYKTLPYKENILIPNDLWKRIFKARIFNYSINVSSQFFKGNFLTPFFAYKFGLKDAGIFNLANHIAESVKAVMKATIIFSGNAVLAQLKQAGITAKRKAFNLIVKKLNSVVYPLVIFIAFNYRYLIKGQDTNTITMSLLFLFIAFTEYFFISYDQFYIAEEQSFKLFLLKILELILYYTFIISNNFYSPVSVLSGIIILRIISFVAIGGNAYFNWKLKPSFKISTKLLFISIILSASFYLVFNFLFTNSISR